MKSDPFMVPPAGGIKIDRGELHVWRATSALPRARIESLKAYLDPTEIERAESFYQEKDRDRLIATHGLMRSILSFYTGTEPEQVRFGYRENRKPMLEREPRGEGLYFNLSHSDEVCAVAIACDAEVGIDIERIREDVAVEDIAESLFTRRESLVLRSLPAALRHEAFFIWWTSKEAFAKATGAELSSLLDGLDLSFVTRRSQVVLDAESELWSLQTIRAGYGYAGAIVSKGEMKSVSYWEWPKDLGDG